MLQFTPWAAVVLASGLVTLVVLAVVWRSRSNPGARLFALLLGLTAFYTFGYVAQIAATTTGGKLFWLEVQYLTIVFIPVASVVFALDYTGHTDWITERALGALLVLPLGTLVAVWLDPAAGLVLTDVHTVDVGGYADLEYGFGPLGSVFWAYAFLLYVVAALLFFALAVRSHAAYRVQGWLLLVAFLAPVVAGGVSIASPAVRVDPTPLAFLLTGVVVTWGVYRSDFLEVVPVDRDRTLDEVRGAVVVLDTRDRIVDVNRTARDFFDESFAIGEHADDALRRAGFDRSVDQLADGATVSRTNGERRRYEVSRDEIETLFDERRGVVVTLYDVTERWRAERRLRDRNEQLEVLSRLLRHDIRNDAAVILGWSEAVRDEVDPEHEAAIERIHVSASHIAELTETARSLTEAVAGEGDLEVAPVALDRVLSGAVAAARSQYPDATFDEPDEYPPVSVLANELLSSVFRNLLNNAVQHSDGDEPAVTVAVDVDGDAATVVVADDGPGIPPELREELFDRGSKGVDSGGSGLGLHLVDHLVDAFDGAVAVEANEPRGTRFAVTLPLAE